MKKSIVLIGAALSALTVTCTLFAAEGSESGNGVERRQPPGNSEMRGESQEIRQDWQEIRQDRQELREDRAALRDALKSGDRDAIRKARQELDKDRREFRNDRQELRKDIRERNELRGDRVGENRNSGPDGRLERRPPPGHETRMGNREIRHDRRELRQDRQEIREDRAALRDARNSGDRDAIQGARQELARDRKELRDDRQDFRRDVHERNERRAEYGGRGAGRPYQGRR